MENTLQLAGRDAALILFMPAIAYCSLAAVLIVRDIYYRPEGSGPRRSLQRLHRDFLFIASGPALALPVCALGVGLSLFPTTYLLSKLLGCLFFGFLFHHGRAVRRRWRNRHALESEQARRRQP